MSAPRDPHSPRPPQYPSIGRIVTYRDPRGVDGLGTDHPAIITGLVGDGFAAHLTVFDLHAERHLQSVPYAERGENELATPHTWRWPERV